MNYSKYHGLGNDYIVIRSEETDGILSEDQIRLICHRNHRLGSDGILLGPLPADDADL
jgi:diaminopimelate epimerase